MRWVLAIALLSCGRVGFEPLGGTSTQSDNDSNLGDGVIGDGVTGDGVAGACGYRACNVGFVACCEGGVGSCKASSSCSGARFQCSLSTIGTCPQMKHCCGDNVTGTSCVNIDTSCGAPL